MNSANISVMPGASELARYLLDIPEEKTDAGIVSVEITDDGKKVHRIIGPTGDLFNLFLAGDGDFCLVRCHPGKADKQVISEHISNTPAEPVVRARTEKIVAALTGYEVELKEWVEVMGIHMGRYLVPVEPAADHVFLYDEDDSGGFEIIKAERPVSKKEARFIENDRIAKGNIDDVLSRDLRYTCKLHIIDPKLFNDIMEIPTIADFKSKSALKHLLVMNTWPTEVGINSFNVDNIEIDIDENIIEMNVIADVEDHRALVAAAREAYKGMWQNSDWYPESAAEALWELTLASNDNPSPCDMGFEIMEMKAVEPGLNASGNLSRSELDRDPEP